MSVDLAHPSIDEAKSQRGTLYICPLWGQQDYAPFMIFEPAVLKERQEQVNAGNISYHSRTAPSEGPTELTEPGVGLLGKTRDDRLV